MGCNQQLDWCLAFLETWWEVKWAVIWGGLWPLFFCVQKHVFFSCFLVGLFFVCLFDCLIVCYVLDTTEALRRFMLFHLWPLMKPIWLTSLIWSTFKIRLKLPYIEKYEKYLYIYIGVTYNRLNRHLFRLYMDKYRYMLHVPTSWKTQNPSDLCIFVGPLKKCQPRYTCHMSLKQYAAGIVWDLLFEEVFPKNSVYPWYLLCSLGILGDYNSYRYPRHRSCIGTSHRGTLGQGYIQLSPEETHLPNSFFLFSGGSL